MTLTARVRELLTTGEVANVADVIAKCGVNRNQAKSAWYQANTRKTARVQAARGKGRPLISQVRELLSTGAASTIADLVTLLGLTTEQAKNAFYAAGARAPRTGAPVPPPPPSGTRLRVVQPSEGDAPEAPPGPAFERCAAAGGLRRDDCALYEDCLDAFAAHHETHARCPAACAHFIERDRSAEFAHLSASRPGGGCSYPEGGL